MHNTFVMYVNTHIDTHRTENTHKDLTDVPSSACNIIDNNPVGEKHKLGSDLTGRFGSLTYPHSKPFYGQLTKLNEGLYPSLICPTRLLITWTLNVSEKQDHKVQEALEKSMGINCSEV